MLPSTTAALRFKPASFARFIGEPLNLVRKYNASYRVDKRTTATYTYASLPEDAAQNLVMTKTSSFSLKRSFNKRLNLAIDYTTGKDLAKKTGLVK